jgi:Trk K+ transport system NAD-binding subunit
MPANPPPVGPKTSVGPKTLMPTWAARSSPTHQDRFIVCGLGSLGQQCVVNLKKFDYDPFEVIITAIDQRNIGSWELDDMPRSLAQPPFIGDCRREDMLRAAGIEHSRAILIVTSNESTNIECAIAARRLNPDIQIILRSSRHSLNTLLGRQLGKFIALDATELPAMTFALAGLGDDIVSVFSIGRHRFRVTERLVRAGDPRFDQQPVQQLHQGSFRLLDLNPVEVPPQPMGWATTASSIFHRWQPHVRIAPGDRVAYIEVDKENEPGKKDHSLFSVTQWIEDFRHRDLRKRLSKLRRSSEESLGRVVAIAFSTALILWVIGTLLLKFSYAGPIELTWVKAISLGAILLLGGYGDVFGGFDPPATPGWVQLVCLIITLTSILAVLGVLGLVAERLLNSRFDFLQKRPRIPRRDHVVVVGLGRIGRKVTSLLLEFNQPMVALAAQPYSADVSTQVPLLIGNILEMLPAANLATAKSVIAVTDDQMLNLEVALLAAEKTLNHRFSPVVRTRSQTFSNNLSAMMPQAQTFCAYALSAEAFAGAAFGENILGLFRLGNQNILIAEYAITSGDTLEGKRMGHIAYGYGVVPILRETSDAQGKRFNVLMPIDDQHLTAGDRLFVLSSINGLRRIERGERTPPRRWHLSADALPPNLNSNLEKSSDLSGLTDLLIKLSGCDPEAARSFIEQLPSCSSMELDLYDYQAARLIQAMKAQLPVRLAPVREAADS